MPNQQINSITSATTSDGTELLPMVSSGITKTISVSNINAGIAVDTVSDVYEARDLAVGQSSIAAAAALASGSITKQDLSSVSAGLHRSPGAITSMFVYDTSKDSDGGAWTKKCQHTSWYNEPLSGKWLGAFPSESVARAYDTLTTGNEIISNGNFTTNTNGWTLGGTATSKNMSSFNGSLLLERFSGNGTVYAYQQITTVIGKTYRVFGNILNVNGPNLVGFIAYQTLGGTVLGSDYRTVSTTLNVGQYCFLFTATSTTTYILAQLDNNTNGSVLYDDISVMEVSSYSNQSNDYYQNSTDGKFYRLWKNLISYSEELGDTSWNGYGATISSNSGAAPNGTWTADRVLARTDNTYQSKSLLKSNSVSVTVGTTYAFSIYAKSDGVRYFSLFCDMASVLFGPSATYFDLQTQTVTQGTGSIVPIGDGWYRCIAIQTATTTGIARPAITLQQSGTGSQYGQNNWSGDGISGMYFYGAQIEQGSVATTYEPKGIEGSVSEVFRGNKREFPKLSAIVAEANNVTIYDLTESGRPMWMRFNDGGTTGIIGWANAAVRSQQCVSIYNGVLVTGSNDGGCIISFTKDDVRLIYSSAYYLFDRKISSRNQTTSFTTGSDGIVISGTSISAIAIAALTAAPIEQSTGLPISTLAIGSAYRVSLIKHDGTIVQSASTVLVPYSLSLTNNYLLGHIGTNANYQPFTMIAVNPALLANNFAFTVFDGSLNKSGVSKMAYSNKNHFATIGNNLTRSKSKNFSRYVFSYDSTSTIASAIDPAGNSGFFLNMTKRSYLGEINSSSLSYTVENGFKYSNTLASWTSNNVQITPAADPGPVGLSSASLVTPKVTNNSGISQGFTYPWGGTFAIKFYAKYAGKRYVALTTSYSGTYYGYAYVDLLSGVVTGATNLCTVSGPDANGYYQIVYKRVMPIDFNQLGEFAVYVSDVNNGLTVSTSTTNGIYLSNFQLEFFSNPNTEFGPYVETTSSIIVREHITNYANGIAELLPFGTIMRTPVATGSQLVAYSGFSA